mgnify:CR=1 FL=1
MTRPPRLVVEIAAGLALTLLAVVVRWPLAPLRGLDSDVMGPLHGALAILGGASPLGGGDAIFGYGRELSWVPLVAGAESLLEVAQRRAVLQAGVVALVFAAVVIVARRRALPGALLGATVAGGIVAWSDDLWRVVLGQYQSYLGVEWGALLVLGVVMLVGPSSRLGALGAVLAGISLPMMAFHVPHAAAVAVVVPLLLWLAPRRRDVLGLVGVAALVSLPHVVRLLSPELGGIEGEGESLLGRFRQVGNQPDVGIVGAVGVYLEATLHGPKLLLLLAPPALLVLARERGDPAERVLGWLALAVVPLGAALVVLAQHGLPWHWLPCLPVVAVCAGLVIARAGPRWGGVGVLVLAALVVGAEQRRGGYLDWPTDTLVTTRQADRAAALLFPALGVPDVTGYQAETQLARRGEASLVPATVSAWMAGDAREGVSGRVGIYLEGPTEWVAEVAARGWPEGVSLVAAGTHFVVLQADDAEAARRMGPSVCREGEPVRPIHAPDVALLPGDHPRSTPSGLHPCALDGSVPKGAPVRQGPLPTD